MTHQNHQTNGASLEDCHTNFFALTDLCGIKWRKFVNGERPNASSDPLDDPILRSYSRCMQADILCVWRRIQCTKQDNPDPNALPFEMSTSRVHPPLSLAAAKELWIFWYGEEPDLSHLVDAELLRVAASQAWNGTWERGLTYECRSLLFKALHNLMERFVLTKDIVRFGKWFVQPCTASDRIFGRSSQHLSFSFTFFVHGDTVCASIDLREHPAVRPLTKEHLAEAAAAIAAASTTSAASSSSSSGNTTATGSTNGQPNGGPTTMQQSHEQNLSASPHDDTCPASMHDGELVDSHRSGGGVGGGAAVSSSNGTSASALNLRPRKVILAPFGMAAILTGNSYKATDPNAEKILEGWSSFFPLCNKDNSDIPPVVEVISGGHKMYHPSIYVLVTDLDDMDEMEAAASQKCALGSTSSMEAAVALAAGPPLPQQQRSTRTIGSAAIDIKPQLPILTPTSNASSPMHAMAAKEHHHLGGQLQQQQQQHQHNNHHQQQQQHLKQQHQQQHQQQHNHHLQHQQQQQQPHHQQQQQQQPDSATAKVPPYYDTLISSFSCNSTNTHAPPQAANEMPERVWQDCITNTLHVAAYSCAVAAAVASTTSSSLSSTSANTCSTNNNNASATSNNTSTSNNNNNTFSSSSSAVGGGTSGALTTTTTLTTGGDDNSNSGSGSGSGQLNQMENLNNNNNNNNNNASMLSTNAADAKTKFWGFIDPTQKAPCICAKSLPPSSAAAAAANATSNQSGGHVGASAAAASAYARNPMLVGDVGGLTVPSLGSPGTPAPSPHTNSALSQPTSVPPADQLIQMSPRAPTSVSQLQQPHTPIEHLLDKNTPAPTPTDQHDNKSITASPYVNPSPSVEAPPSAEGMIGSVAPDSVPPPSSVGRCTPTPTLGGSGGVGGTGTSTQPHQQLLHDLMTSSPATDDQKRFELPDELIAAADIKLEPGVMPPTQASSIHKNNCWRNNNNNNNNKSSTSNATNALTAASATEQMKDFLKLYKTPQLSVKDSDCFTCDDLKLDVLYDFSVQDAWVNHPMKRLKPNDIVNAKPLKKMRLKNIYEGHTHFKPLMPSPGSGYGSQLLTIDSTTSTVCGIGGLQRLDMSHMDGSLMGSGSGSCGAGGGSVGGGLVGIAPNVLSSSNGTGGGVGVYATDNDKKMSTGGFLLDHEIKTEIMSTDTASPCKEEKMNVGENFYTAEGLNPSMKDLDQIFETSSNDDCGSVQIHTPPDSNNPSNVSAPTNTIDELKRNTSVTVAAVAAAAAAAAAASASGNSTATGPGLVSSLGAGGIGGNSATSASSMAALQNCTISTTTTNASAQSINNSGANTIQAEDLTKMFPTPPSHDQHHPNSSPCQMDIQMTDLSVITTTTTTSASSMTTATATLDGVPASVLASTTTSSTTGTTVIKIKQEYSIELGSPAAEPIDDWSYVFKPPQQAIFVGSSKYAPLTNLPSQMLQPLVLPSNCVYKPSWTQQQSRAAAAVAAAQQQQQQQQHQQQHQQQQQQQHHHQVTTMSPMNQQQQHPQQPAHSHGGGLPQHLQQQLQQQSQPQQHPPPHPHQQLHELLSSGPRPTGNNMLLNQLNCPQAALTNTPGSGPTMQQLMQRAGMSPISPAAQTPGAVPFPRGSPMMQPQRQTPIHPPPPYEMAVASPATSTSSYLNKQFNSQEPPQTPQSVGMPHLSGGNCGGGNGGVGGHSGVAGGQLVGPLGGLLCTAGGAMSAGGVRDLPEVSSLIVNILLYDTALNVFRDHNFDSSTVCVCNADSQKVGNIRGADSGVYVPLPGTTFNPAPPSQSSSAAQAATHGAVAAISAAGSSANAMSGGLRMLSAFGGGGGGGGGGGSALDSPASLPGAGSGNTGSSSSTSSTTTPAAASNQHITGYLDDDPVDCTCGFSAVINRRLAYGAGLFYEDEMEITGIADDPGRHKKPSLLSMITSLSMAFSGANGTGAKAPGSIAKSITASATTTSSTSITTSKSSLIAVQSNDGPNSSGGGGGGITSLQSIEQLTHSIMDLLVDQCSIIQTYSSSVHRTLQSYRRRLAKHHKQPHAQQAIANALEYVDANDIMCLALEQARLAFENTRLDINEFSQHTLSPFHSAMTSHVRRPAAHSAPIGSQLTSRRPCAHKWPYIPVGFTRSNKDIVRTMNSIQPMLQNAFHSKSRSAAGAKDATYTVSGPLTWRQFHRLAGRASGQCEPQPIPSVIVGHEKDWMSVAPLAIHYWDKFLLEPYSYARDVVYLIVCPDNEYVVSNTRTYFKELSSTYEMCKLGRHTPMRGWDGLLTVGPRPANDKWTTCLDDWLRTLEDCSLAEKLRLYANTFQNMLAPYLSRIPNDKTILLPPEQQQGHGRDRSATISPMNSGMPGSGNIGGMGHMSGGPMGGSGSGPSATTTSSSTQPVPMDADKSPKMESSLTNPTTATTSSSASSDQLIDSNPDSKADVKGDTKPAIVLGDPLGMGETMEEINSPVIVLYVVEPFTFGSDSSDLERLACVALLRCYSEMLKAIPDSVKANMNIQIISLESILELGRTRNRKRFSDEMRCLALNIFSQCRRTMIHAQPVKSLTGFGTAANMEQFLKTKDDKNRQAYRMYTPPYILAPMHEKTEKSDFSRSLASVRSVNEQKYSVMYCNYCISEDQSWLLASVTDDRGEMLEKVCINIDVPNRSRRRKAPARRVSLKKLMDFIMGLISQTAQPWRLVIGRIGRIGHSELKSWSYLLSKQNLQKASKQLKDICKQCTLMYPPSILSACLITLEPDAKLRVMPDQFTPDERFSQISMQNPLSTPQDVTCTHILVFPTSAVCLSFTRQFHNEPQVDLDNDFLNFDECEDENEGFGDAEMIMGELGLNWDSGNLGRLSNHGSPDRMEDNRSWHSAGGSNFNSTQQQDVEEVGSINQQPLAVGYMVSTAPTGRMPAWFWAACPHVEDVCPVFLKTALHLHVPNIQTTDDILNSTNAHSSAIDHPLDSTLTADVLRYVLEGYNALSWLALDSNTHDRLSCLPIHVQTLMDLYYLVAAIA